MDRKVIRAWCLYDFGNSAFAMLFPSLFSVVYIDQIVGNAGTEGDRAWSLLVSAAMLSVALLAPFLGGVADHAGVRKRMLGVFTLVGVACVLGWTTLRPGDEVPGFVLGLLAMVGFEASIVFYNAYLPRIAPASHQGRVSAWGFAVGYVGSLVALGVAAVLDPRERLEWVWVALALQWVGAALPAFLVLPADVPTGVSLRQAASRGVRGTWHALLEVARTPHLRWFLLGFFCYMDGVETVIVFAASYAKKTLGFSTTELLGLFALVQVTALLGSLALARPTDVRGPRFTVRLTLLWWVLTVCAAYLAQTKLAFWIVGGAAGLGLGAVQSASRAMMGRLAPPGREAEMFGFMALCGRSGSVLGPFIFGLVVSSSGSQRLAVLSVIPFYLVGLVLLTWVRSPAVGPAPGAGAPQDEAPVRPA
jgi:UMF1 family MFS transporter